MFRSYVGRWRHKIRKFEVKILRYVKKLAAELCQILRMVTIEIVINSSHVAQTLHYILPVCIVPGGGTMLLVSSFNRERYTHQPIIHRGWFAPVCGQTKWPCLTAQWRPKRSEPCHLFSIRCLTWLSANENTSRSNGRLFSRLTGRPFMVVFFRPKRR